MREVFLLAMHAPGRRADRVCGHAVRMPRPATIRDIARRLAGNAAHAVSAVALGFEQPSVGDTQQVVEILAAFKDM